MSILGNVKASRIPIMQFNDLCLIAEMKRMMDGMVMSEVAMNTSFKKWNLYRQYFNKFLESV